MAELRSKLAAAAPVSDGFVTTLRRVKAGGQVTGQVAREVTGVVAGAVAGEVTPPVTPPVVIMVRLLGELGELGNAEIRQHLGLSDRTHLRERYVDPSLDGGWIEMTIPDKPNNRLQKYRLTAKGPALLATVTQGKRVRASQAYVKRREGGIIR